ncbi:three-Cys-motif partner protein TcmP [Labrys wisconsinensis]|uniref:Three-Cys-motif partner protein n=1 Tax=Labrys wisconsinensis TaxID=425677 RepID=A0ABU0IYE6_9HYPH|nr:three-Cys-motif partner protein TcmP [Labrys wisconsinensis]MDQ0467035.1 three-Cys-motif partner protein [Labrys wisconsinensis]
MALSDHEFGGVSTDLKLSLVEKYLTAFTTALQNQFSDLWYIDAFAGTGERTRRIAADLFAPTGEDRVERNRGSARIAIEVNPQFNRLIFMDKNPKHCAALRSLKSNYPDRQIDILEGDANTEVVNLLRNRKWTSTRAVMFLDPYGMSVAWQTLEAIRETEAIDVWYLVSLSGMFRQAARKANAVAEEKRAALTRMLGTDEWEAAWYERTQKADLFGSFDEQHSRTADVDAMQDFMQKRLEGLFPKVLKPLRLHDERGIPQFALFFAISNPRPKAIGLATKIASHILNSGRLSHVRP